MIPNNDSIYYFLFVVSLLVFCFCKIIECKKENCPVLSFTILVFYVKTKYYYKEQSDYFGKINLKWLF